MGGKSSTLSWLTVPLRWTPVSAAELLEARRVPPAALFSHEAAPGGSSEGGSGGGSVDALLGTASDALVARCTGLLFGPRAIALPAPDSAGGYSSVLSQLLQASCAELDGLVQGIADSAERHSAAAAAAAPFACLADGALPVPARNYRILVLHLVRLTEQYCTIDASSDESLAASILLSSSVCDGLLLPPPFLSFSLARSAWCSQRRGMDGWVGGRQKQERRELLCGIKLLSGCASYFLETYGQTPGECLDFASVAPTPELAISMRTRLPSSLAVFVVRRAALLRQLWDSSSDADAPGVQVLVLVAHMLVCLASLFATQMALPADTAADSPACARLDAAAVYAALRCQGDALVAPTVHALLSGFVVFAGIAAASSSVAAAPAAPAPASTEPASAVPAATALASASASASEPAGPTTAGGAAGGGDRELSWYPNLFSVRPVSLGEAVVDVGRSLFHVVSFPVRLVFQGARAVFYTHRLSDIEVILPTAMADAFRRRDTTGTAVAAALADVFAALLVTLVHPTASAGHAPFRAALCALADSHFASPPPQQQQAFAQIDYPALFNALAGASASGSASGTTAAAVHMPLRMLLLYFLLEGNRGFREYVYARPDCETLLLPLLHELYVHTPVGVSQDTDEDAEEEEGDSSSAPGDARDAGAGEEAADSAQHQYAVLLTTILHMLSEDAAFARGVHAVPLAGGVPWYRDAYLPRTTLGGLLVLVLLRVLARNLRYARDAFLHTGCVATLANLAPHFVDLPALPATRLVRFVGVVHRHCCFLKTTAAAASSSSPDGRDDEDEDETLTTFRGFLRAQLRIVLDALRCGLEHNPNIVYAVLQEQPVFAALAADPAYAALAQPLCDIAAYFAAPAPGTSSSSAAAAAASPEGAAAAADVLRTVVQRAPACRAALGLVPAAPEAYGYAEDAHGAWHFFEALAWRAVVAARAVPFSPALVRLFAVPGAPPRTTAGAPANSEEAV